MKTLTFHYYADPGHGWVKVSFRHLERIVGKHWRSLFTPYSFERGEYAYLEEDEDVSRFIDCCRGAGIEPVFRDHTCASRQSRIRNYSSLRTTL